MLTSSTHWGAFLAEVDAQRRMRLSPHPADGAPSPLLRNVPAALDHPTRVRRPAVRRGWLEHGPGADPARGRDGFVEVPWDEALDLAAGEMRRVYARHGGQAIFGGSYGWASAGCFHHAQSQVRRFLNLAGGCTEKRNDYSSGAALVLFPHVIGAAHEICWRATEWNSLAEHTELVVAFGGMPLKNEAVMPGGKTEHVQAGFLECMASRGTKFVLVGPLKDDLPASVDAEWIPIRPGTDVAFMLGIAQVLDAEGLLDLTFLQSHCEGYGDFAPYLRGLSDGVPKTPEWACGICGTPAEDMRRLAQMAVRKRTFLSSTYSLQRAEHGEQPIWMLVVLAAMIGQIGSAGGGFGYGYGSIGNTGMRNIASMPTLPVGSNPVDSFIPVARVADMLLHPGASYDYDGTQRTYPEVSMVYWAGGNPFHHHQDLVRLTAAFARPDTVVVHECFWTATAKHADIVFPINTPYERNDIGASANDRFVIAMKALAPSLAESRSDHWVFARLAERLGFGDAMTEGRNEAEWLVRIYEDWRKRQADVLEPLPDFAEFWHRGTLQLVERNRRAQILFRAFRDDPLRNPLPTPSGRIEIHSKTIAGFGYDDCPGHPMWLAPKEWLGSPLAERFPLQLIANNPSARLHGQLDFGAHSAQTKIDGREPIRMNPKDAGLRALRSRDIARVFNDRGACLAGVILSEDVRPGCVQLSTGAWYDPRELEPGRVTCVHGNPNVLTADRGTSRLAQGCSGQLTLVQVERFAEPLPPVQAWSPPPLDGLRRPSAKKAA